MKMYYRRGSNPGPDEPEAGMLPSEPARQANKDIKWTQFNGFVFACKMDLKKFDMRNITSQE